MRVIVILLALATTACDLRLPEAFAGAVDADPALKVRGRAIDGDTVLFDVRLFGADAVERKQSCQVANATCWQCGKAAQDFAAKLLKSGPATIQLTGQQSYGRPIGSIMIGGRDMGEAMIAAGYAVPTPNFLKRDPERAARYAAAYKQAVADRVGIHAGKFVDPSHWRKGERLACERQTNRSSSRSRD